MSMEPGGPELPSQEELEARCAQVLSEWSITDRVIRGRVMVFRRRPSPFVREPGRRKKLSQSPVLENQNPLDSGHEVRTSR